MSARNPDQTRFVLALPPREHAVLAGLARGLRYRAIARELEISEARARGYAHSARLTLGVPTVYRAVALFSRLYLDEIGAAR